MSNQTLLEPLWAFARRDLAARPFRDLLYETAALEALLGAALYLDLLALDFSDPRAVAEQRAQLRNHLLRHHPPQCDCPLTGSHERLPIGITPADLEQFDVLRRRTPWLELGRCRTCGTLWYIAVDMLGDDFYFRRVDQTAAAAIIDEDRWPTDFDDKPAFWPDAEWLTANGYVDLAAWQRQHGTPTP